MHRRIVTIIEEYCDECSRFHDLTLKLGNGAGEIQLEGGQEHNHQIHQCASAAQGGIDKLAASPEDQGAIEAVVNHKRVGESETTSVSNVDVTVQPQTFSLSRLGSIKSRFVTLSRSVYVEFAKQLLTAAVKTLLRIFLGLSI